MSRSRNGGALEGSPGSAWPAAAQVAARQLGVISVGQLREVGLSDAAIESGVAGARLHRLFPAVYALGHPGVGWQARMMAATLACGAGTVVSHGSAAFLLGLWQWRPEEIDVIAPVEAGRKIAGIRRRFTPPPTPDQLWNWEGVPCASPSRTIVDVAGIAGERSLRRTVEQAAVRGLLDVAAIRAILTGPRRRGSPLLRLVLSDWREHRPGVVLRSPLEAKLYALLGRSALRGHECNAIVWAHGERYEVDFLWRESRLVVETDGGDYHDNPEAQARDARRDADLRAAGYRVLRLRRADLDSRSNATLTKLTRHLGARSAVP